jgi:GT2 family glycosyltransferase
MVPRFFVIVPSYEHFAYCARTIDSCLECAPDAFVFVVDDASPGWPRGSLPRDLLPFHNHERVAFACFERSGGLTRSWNAGLAQAIGMGIEYAVCGNNDLVFSPGWTKGLVEALVEFDLVGPVSNAPGTTAPKHQQLVTTWDHNYYLSDDEAHIAATAQRLKDHVGKTVESPINGYCMMARTEVWDKMRFDADAVFDPSKRMVNNEDEFQKRLRLKGGRSAVVPSSFVFHYRSVARGVKYARGKGMWMRQVDHAK